MASITKRGPAAILGLLIGAAALAMGQTAAAGTIQVTTPVYQLDSSEPGLPNYTPSVAIPAIETINPNAVPSDASFTYVQPTPGSAAASAGQAQIVQGSVSGQYAAPYSQNGLPITSSYYSAGGGQIIVNFNDEKTYFGLLWGSVDAYNSLVFNNVPTVNGVTTVPQVAALTGNSVLTGANGNQAVGGAVWLNMDFLNSNDYNQVVFSDIPSEASFEFAAISTNTADVPIVPTSQGGTYSQPGISTAVPEPASLALFGAGLAAIAVFSRRRVASLLG